ncbi:MAG: pentapeptide repeat-containing protein [Gammaproteobacteria bacterium]|nr:pentapeptide repeat-containing protein [Gammaproteobacteria bacterium]
MNKSMSLLVGILVAWSIQSSADEVNVGGGAVKVDDEGVSVGGVVEINSEGIKVPGVEINTGGVVVGTTGQSGQVFTGDDFSDSDLSGRRFVGVKFVGVDFSDSNLTGADFSGAYFQGVDFSDANLTNVNFSDATSQGSDFSDSNLQGACFIRARLTGNDFSDSALIGTIFTDAQRIGDDFSEADISATIWDGPEVCPHAQQAAARPEVTTAAVITQTLAQGKDARVDLTVNFEFDSDKIRDKGHVQVMEIANALKSSALANHRVMIEGHTDSVGDDGYNLDLSYRRAIIVMRALSEQYGIDQRRLQVNGFGETKPVVSNDTDPGRALNRRVTLVNLGSG